MKIETQWEFLSKFAFSLNGELVIHTSVLPRRAPGNSDSVGLVGIQECVFNKYIM